MSQQIPSKLQFDRFYQSIQSTLNYPDVEKEMISKVENYVSQISAYNYDESLSDHDFLERYLVSNTNTKLGIEEKLRIILQTGDLSIERMKRFSEHHFKQPLQSALSNKMNRKIIIDVLLNKHSEHLKEVPPFQKLDFCLPDFWRNTITNKDSLFRLARAKFSSKIHHCIW